MTCISRCWRAGTRAILLLSLRSTRKTGILLALAVQSLIAVKSAATWWIALFHNTPAQFHGRPELVQQLTEELQQLQGASNVNYPNL